MAPRGIAVPNNASLTAAAHSSPVYRVFQLLLLAAAASTANYIRTTLGPLQEAMRVSLSLSDNHVAILQGLAVALPLALGGIPIGLLADRISRKVLLVTSLCFALIASILSSFAGSFGFLLFARFLTGLSLPGMYICAYAMAGDLFGPEHRGRATTVVAIGEIGGPPAAFALGGALLVMLASSPWMKFADWPLPDWGWSLLWMGGATLPVLLLLLLLLHEPPRREVAVEKPPVRVVWRELWKYRAVAMPLQLARATLFIADGAVYVWGAPLFSRKFHMAPDRIGAVLGLALLAGGLFGPALGGPLVDFCQRRGGPRRTMVILTVIAALSSPFGLFPLLPDSTWAAVALAAFLTLGYSIAAAALALTLIVIPGELRGLNIGISLMVGALFFVGLAPLAVSGLSVALGGEMMIGNALAIVCAVAVLLSSAVFASTARYFPGADPTTAIKSPDFSLH